MIAVGLGAGGERWVGDQIRWYHYHPPPTLLLSVRWFNYDLWVYIALFHNHLLKRFWYRCNTAAHRRARSPLDASRAHQSSMKNAATLFISKLFPEIKYILVNLGSGSGALLYLKKMLFWRCFFMIMVVDNRLFSSYNENYSVSGDQQKRSEQKTNKMAGSAASAVIVVVFSMAILFISKYEFLKRTSKKL